VVIICSWLAVRMLTGTSRLADTPSVECGACMAMDRVHTLPAGCTCGIGITTDQFQWIWVQCGVFGVCSVLYVKCSVDCPEAVHALHKSCEGCMTRATGNVCGVLSVE
jgi:hypothetical protein